MTRSRGVEAPSWRTLREAVALILRGVTFHIASRIALVVGTVLSLVNQSHIIFAGEATPITWVRVAVNYLVPYTVASLGYLAPLRREGADGGDELT